MRFALEEWLSNLSLCGTRCACCFEMEESLSFAEAVELYGMFQGVLMRVSDTLSSLLVTARTVGGAPRLVLNLCCGETDIPARPGVEVSDEWTANGS